MTSELACPNCQTEMTRENFVSAFVDVCVDGCQGLWFDGGELAKLDHTKKGIGPALQRALAQPIARDERENQQLACPRCETPLEQNGYELAAWVVVDECPSCDGIFLDAGELKLIRARPMTDTEERSARRHRKARRKIQQRKLEEAVRRARADHLSIIVHQMF